MSVAPPFLSGRFAGRPSRDCLAVYHADFSGVAPPTGEKL